MPRWEINTTKNLLSPSEKQDLAKSITSLYTKAGLPAFYVNILYIEHEKESLYDGPEQASNLVVIRIEHLARQFKDLAHKQRYMADADAVLAPVLRPKGGLHEYTISEPDRDLWKINGIVPPLPRTEMERKWVAANWPVEY